MVRRCSRRQQPAVTAGSGWTPPDHGRVPETVRDRLAAESLYGRGSTPYPSLRRHRASFATRPDALPSQALTAARQTAVATLDDRDQLAEERAWMRLTIGRHVASSSPMPDRLSARAALERVPQGQDYSLARLIGAALHSGLDPKSFPIPSELPADVVSGRAEPTPGIEHQRREPPGPDREDRKLGQNLRYCAVVS